MISQPAPGITRTATTLLVALTLLAGCQSKQDAAIEQAKKQATATGQPQQVVSTDKNGNTVTTTVQPLQSGQTTQAVTTTVTPAANSNSGQPAAPPAAPIIRPADVSIAAGTPLIIRINQHISVKSSHPGQPFTGEIEAPILNPGNNDPNTNVLIPRGTPVDGVVDAAHRRGHFAGHSILELRLTALTLNGTRYPLDTHDLTRTKKGKGKRSAAFIGTGAGAGMLIGGIATGGVGLVVGGLVGGGTGTALGGLTGNRDIEIPAESIVRFRLADNLVVQNP